jgi:CrcB protein
MKKYLAVGVGGAAGAVVRYCVGQIPLPFNQIYHPVLTMMINMSGSFLLGLLMILFVKLLPVPSAIRLGVTTGFLGGFTTFSTLCKESVLLAVSGNILLSSAYIFLSLFLGIAAAWLGIFCGKRLERRRFR